MERFFAEEQCDYSTKLPTESNKLDLTLKLSPCGENPEERRLKRSSSVVANGAQWGPFVASLDRSSSLPEEGLVRFGELQTMRRAETGKRMLLERQRMVVAAAAVEAGGNGKCPPEVLALVTAPSSDDKLKAPANPSGDSKHEGGSCNIPHLDRTRSAEGLDSNIQRSTKQENDSMVSKKTTLAKGIPPRPADTNVEIPSKRFKLGNYCSLKGDVMEILRQMPSVTTTGDGPNGKRIEGFLYKYRTGQICIVCVCHGNFLTPAEFILHAGGKEVENPMKHITVYTNSF